MPRRSRRSSSPATASSIITAARCRQTTAMSTTLGVELGYRWTAVQAAGPLRARRHGELSELGADERHPRQGRGRRAHRHGGAGAGRRRSTRSCWSAAELAGVDEIYRVGGAQAIAALAYGTETIAPVDKIVGPGNAYVAAAKRQVFGHVGIDMIAGPSEVVVIADARQRSRLDRRRSPRPGRARRGGAGDPDHRRCAASAAPSPPPSRPQLADAAARERRAGELARASAPSSWSDASTDAPSPSSTASAPEHLEIATDDPEALRRQIRNAGAIFLGRYTPEVIGDYVAGPNHVLPTARSAALRLGAVACSIS